MNPQPDLPRAFLLSILAATATACGGFADDPGEPNTLTTLQGEVRNPDELAVPSNLHVALIWTADGYNIPQELPLVPEFPARYELRITELPPTMPMAEEDDEPIGDGSGRWALGVVVGYEDGNGNGELDLSTVDVPSPDRVVAAHPDQKMVIYIEGSDAVLDALGQDLGTRPDRGFGFLTFKPSEEHLVDVEYGSISQPFDLMLTDDPQLSDVLCEAAPGSSASGGTVRRGRPAGTHPSPSDPRLTCGEDGSSYSYETCTEYDQGLCRGTHTDCLSEIVPRPDPVPSDWPCP
jgi:hypothetical protein